MTFIQQPMFDPPTEWFLPKLCDQPSWAEAKRIAIDLETCDPELKKTGIGVRRSGFIAGISFAIDGGPAEYLPIGHASGPNLEAASVIQYLKDQAAVFKGELVGANLPYDLDYLAQVGVWFHTVSAFRDVQVAEPLIDELRMSYSLANVAKYNGIPGKDESALRSAAAAWGLNPKSEMWKLPAKHVAKYAIQDVELPLQLIRRQHRKIDEQGLWDVYNLESKVLPVLLKMRRRGVRVDLGKLEQVETFCDVEIAKAIEGVRHLTGYRIGAGDLNLPDVIEGALNSAGLTVGKTKGRKNKEGIFVGQKPKSDRATLEALDHDVARFIVRAKRFDKVKGTFVQSIIKHQVAGRIHPTFRQLKGESDFGDGDNGAAFGRLSCVDPNLQQQPARDPELGPLWRSIYIPEEGALWACCDFSSQEPRIAAHYAIKTGCDGAEALHAKYHENPNLDFHQMMADTIKGAPASKKERSEAKAIFLGLCYGMGGAKLCASLGLPTVTKYSKRLGKEIQVAGPQGQALLDHFDEMVPWVGQLSMKTQNAAKKNGYIITLAGRRCRFPRKPDGSFDWTFKALNRLIQGSAADQGKAALVALDDAGAPLQLQVHDEFDFSADSIMTAEQYAEVMAGAFPISVPTIVDVETGKNWGYIS